METFVASTRKISEFRKREQQVEQKCAREVELLGWTLDVIDELLSGHHKSWMGAWIQVFYFSWRGKGQWAFSHAAAEAEYVHVVAADAEWNPEENGKPIFTEDIGMSMPLDTAI